MKIKLISIKNVFYSIANNNIFNEKRPYIKSNSSNFKSDYKRLSGDYRVVSNDLKKTIEKNKKYLYV